MAKRGQALRRSRAAKRPAKPAVNPKEEIAALKRELAQALNQQAAATHDLQVSLEYQTATSDVLRVISHSTFDLQRILDTLVATAVRLCRADLASINIRDGEVYRVVASFDYSPELLAYARNFPMAPGRGTVTGRAALERQVVHVADLAADPEYNAPAWITFGKVRTGLGVPLLREGEPIGVIFLARRRMEPFAEGQIALVRTFADQAVIAIENTRLLTEQRQSLEQQTATAEVLQVINSSPGDLAPVFDAMLEKAMGLCEAAFGVLWTYDGAVMHPAAHQGVPPALTKFLTQGPYPVGEINAHARLLRGEPVVHIADVADTETYRSGDPVRRALVELGGGRTMLAVPLRKEKTFLGDFVIYRQEVKPFSEKQIALLENFAAQAVIAMENARLITETREALERQTATAEVLQVINSSPGDLAPVFDAILEKAHNLCAVAHGSLQLYDGERFRAVAVHGLSEAFADRLRQGWIPSPNHPGQQLLKGVRFVHVPELAEIGDPMARAAAELSGLRTALFIPLRKDATLLGEIVAARREVRPFSDKEIALLESFAAQAVIAMENARLITETREALEQQTATAEVLQVINSSPGDLAPVFDAMLEKAMRLCQAAFGIMRTFDGTSFQLAAERGVPEAFLAIIKKGLGPSAARAVEGRRAVHIVDLMDTDLYRSGDLYRRAIVDLAGGRTFLVVPLLKDEAVRGTITIYRQEVRPFTDKQIALLQNFAAQAVIAMENARLITETREALEQQTATAEILQVINTSPGKLEPVFDAILNEAHRLCAVTRGVLGTYDGEYLRAVTTHGIPEPLAELLRKPFRPSPNSPQARLVSEKRVIHIPDLAAEPGDYPIRTAALEMGVRTLLLVPLGKDDELLGYFSANRTEVRPFSDKEIALLENFAAQAVIAMENARLLDEIRHRNDELAEALEFQTATGEVLRIVASSPDHLQPVFDAMLEKATELCEAKFGVLFLYDGKAFTVAADRNLPPAYAQFVRGQSFSPETNSGVRHLVESKTPLHIRDMSVDAGYAGREPLRVASVELGGVRSMVAVPLLKKGEIIGSFAIYRDEPGGFAENQIALVTTFADQAVIAIENARLFGELRQRTSDLARSVDELTATGDVLKIISRSSTDLETVLNTLVETVARLCRADQTYMLRRRDGLHHLVAAWGVSAEAKEFILTHPFAPDRGSLAGRTELERRAVHIRDVSQDPEYAYREAQKVTGARTALGIPLLRENALIGVFSLTRTRVEPFTDKEIELASTFADQAVIAIENARLFDELRERQAELARSVDELTATGDVLKIISRSSVDLETVLDTLVETVARLCRADQAGMFRQRGDLYHLVAAHGLSTEAKEFILAQPMAPGRGTVTGRVELERRVIHIPDVLQDPEYTYWDRQKITGFRSMLGIPLLREEKLIGILIVQRTRVEPFTSKEIELATSFADQAVIAIENARLFDELRERQAELARSVDELTATGDVLKIISRSSVELQTVLDTLVDTVTRLCRADYANMYRRRDDKHHLVASCGLSEEAREFIRAHPVARGRGTMSGRVELERRAVHIADVLQDSEYTNLEHQKIGGFRTMLGIPLLRGDELIGHFNINRTRVEPFTNKEIELATTFADQAVIAIENARLFDELRDRQAELRVTFDNMGDGVVMFDADRRLAAWNRNFQEILDLPDAFLAERPSYTDYFRYLAERGEYSADLEAELGRYIEDTSREMRVERTRPDGRVIEVRRNAVPGGGFVMIYADITERKRAEAAISAARDAAEAALRELQTAQASLVHAQKMAALGQLTAGIAHEIKNPLNFVNNFAGLSVELLDELKQASAKAVGALDADERAEITETIEMLTGNLVKIADHGRRADGIVRSMLQHSRGGSGDWQSSDLNALVEEALNLAYHGARAQDQSFNITMERDFDQNLAPVEVVPQDVMRVFLNLIGNGFYAANQRSSAGDGAFRPVLKVTTREVGDAVEIRVRDNGVGIPREHREKLFQPFFTTKPTGEGTGLGLSISFDIVTQQHGGTITVESEVGQFTEFTVRLPRRRHSAAGRVA